MEHIYPITLNQCQKEIISVLRKWSDADRNFDGIWYGYNKLYEELECKYSIKHLKNEMKLLRKFGIVFHEVAWDADYMLNGSGNFLNEVYK
jgi:hypothetical protein